MTLEATLARRLFAVAMLLTPASHKKWALAMSMEAEALPHGSMSLGWAFGCVNAAIGWRIEAEMPLAVALLLANFAGWFVYTTAFNLSVSWLDSGWQTPMIATGFALQGLMALGLAVIWPNRAAVSVLLVSLTWQFGQTTSFLMTDLTRAFGGAWNVLGNNSTLTDNLFPFWFFAGEAWPSMLGAAIGWALVRFGVERKPSSGMG